MARMQGPVMLLIFTFIAMDCSSREKRKNEGDTITFSGYQWVVKDSKGRHTGPGLNYFSDSEDNVRVNEEGKLVLKITQRNDKWYCPEVRLIDKLGYGKFIFHLDPLKQPLDKDVVIGMFTYDREDTGNYHKEIDIEFSTWGKTDVPNSQYVIQPNESEAYRFQTNLSRPSIHSFEIRKKKIIFESRYNAGLNPDSVKKVIARYKYKPVEKYEPGEERICINVWLYQASEPASLKEFEVVISKFEYAPFRFFGPCNKIDHSEEEL